MYQISIKRVYMAKTARRHLGEILYKAGLVEKQALIDAIKTGQASKKRLGEVLIEKGLIDEENLAKAIAKQFDMKYVNLDTTTITPESLKLVPEDLIKKHNVPLPVIGEPITMVLNTVPSP